MRKGRQIRLTIAALAALAALATTADAADYSISGEARDRRGAIELPLAETLLGVGRGIAIEGSAMQTGAAVAGGGPATITLAPGVVLDDPTVNGGFLIPVPSVIQLTTLVKHEGPVATTTLMAGRSGPTNFAFCPNAPANPYCTTPAAGGNQGTLNGLIRYTAGPNKFGGTFVMLMSGSGKLTRKGNALPPSVMTTMGATRSALPFSGINSALGGSETAHAGLSYSAMRQVTQFESPRSHPYGYKNTPMGLLSRGPVIGSGLSQFGDRTGFPMTTGVVYGYAQLGSQAPAVAPPFKATSSGYDKRTPDGAGRIQFVSGGLSRSFPTDGSNPPEGSVVDRVVLNMAFLQQPALPLSSPATLTALASLLMLAAGYTVTRKR